MEKIIHKQYDSEKNDLEKNDSEKNDSEKNNSEKNNSKKSDNSPFFSVIIVSLNPGTELLKTVESIMKQSWGDFEIVVKDGGSTDGSLKMLEDYRENFLGTEAEKSRIKLISSGDSGIYDAMNRAIDYCEGRYYIFMNCGDYMYDDTVLETAAHAIGEYAGKSRDGEGDLPYDQAGKGQEPASKKQNDRGLHPMILYGHRFSRINGTVEYAAPEITPTVCYRNIPCHQCCIYDADLFTERRYNTKYQVRADYEHFLWCFFKKNARMHCLDRVVASYQGGGYSETEKNRRISKLEHREITGLYMNRSDLFKCRAYMLLTLQPLRQAMASNKALSPLYNAVVKLVYSMKGTKNTAVTKDSKGGKS